MRKSSERKKSIESVKLVPVFALLLALSCIAPASLAAQETAHPVETAHLVPDSMGVVSCSINGVAIGDVEVGIYNDAPVLAVETLKNLIGDLLRPDIFDTIFNVLFRDLEWLSADEMAVAGIGWNWDMNNIMLSLKLPPAYAPVQDIDITPSYPVNIKPILKPSPVSGHIDFSVEADLDIKAAGVAYPLEGSADAILNIFDWIASASGSVRYADNVLTASLSSSQVTRDFPGINGRLFLGRVATPGLSYQSQPELYGATLKSEEIVKYRVKPGFYELFSEFTVETPSIVRIKLNNMTYRTISLSPGNYRLLDLPFTYGLNDFILEIEDDKGNTTSRRAVIPREMNLLVEGLSEYSFSAGVGKADPTQPFGSGYYRYGFSPRLTAGLMGQVDLRSAMGGLSVIYAAPFGSITAYGSAVAAWDGRAEPFTGAATLQYRFIMPGKEYIPSLGLSAEYIAAGYAAPTPSASSTGSNEILRVGAQLGGKLAKLTGFSLSGYWTRTVDGTASDAFNGTLSINQSIGEGASLSFISNLSFTAGSATPDFSATLMLFVLPRNKPGRSVSYIQAVDGTNSMNFVDKLDVLGGLDLNLRGSNLMIGNPDGSSIGLTARKALDWTDLSISGDYYYGDSTVDDRANFQATMSTTLAYAGGYFAITKQIDDSFVIFAPSKEMSDQNVYFRLESSSAITTQKSRPKILPLTSYKPTAAYMDLPEAPPDIMARIQAALLVPTYRSGIVYTSDILRRYKASGKLQDAKGAPIGYVAGDVVDSSSTTIGSTFTDEEGFFEIYDLLPGSYRILWPEFIGTTDFELKETIDGAMDLGTISATAAAPPAN
jgi:outer membrane usher protein